MTKETKFSTPFLPPVSVRFCSVLWSFIHSLSPFIVLYTKFIKSTHTSTKKTQTSDYRRYVYAKEKIILYYENVYGCVCVQLWVQNKVFTVIYGNSMSLIEENGRYSDESNFANIQEMPETIMSPSAAATANNLSNNADETFSTNLIQL